jgi:peptidylprolyl isomerase
MRIVSRVLVAALTLVVVTGCVSRTGPAVIPAASQPPSESPVAGECATTDVAVTGDPGGTPSVRVPADCAPPTTLLARDLTRGDGPQAVAGSDLEVSYVLVTWSDGEVLDSTWYAGESLPTRVDDLGRGELVRGWNEGLPGIREGGRRLLVVPPATGLADESGDGDTLIFVVDAVRVSRG